MKRCGKPLWQCRRSPRGAAAALKLSTGRDVQFGAALALTFSGDVEVGRIEGLVNELARRFPDNTMVRFSYLPTIRAHLAVNRNDTSKAIETLRAATPYELASPGGGAFSPAYATRSSGGFGLDYTR
jgi:hypothetical protein